MGDNTNLYNLLTTCSGTTCSSATYSDTAYNSYFTPIQYIPTWTYGNGTITATASNMPFLNKENSSNELKINIKKHQIKFNFNL